MIRSDKENGGMKMKQMSLSKKIMILLAVPLLSMIVIAIVGRLYIGQMADAGEELYRNDLLPMQYLGQIRTDERAIDGYLLELILSTETERNEELEADIAERRASISSNLKALNDMFDPKDETMKAHMEDVTTGVTAYLEGVDLVLRPALREENAAAYRTYLSDLRPTRLELVDSAASLMEGIKQEAETSNEEIQQSLGNAIVVFWVTAALAFLTSIALGVYIARLILRPIKQLSLLMERAGEGDLTVHGTYASRDEIGLLVQAFNAMKDNLRHLIEQVTATSDRVAVSSDDLKNNVEETTKATEMVAMTMEEIASGSMRQLTRVKASNETLTDLTNGIHHVSTNAQHMTELSETTLQKVASGNELIETLEHQLDETNEKMKQLQQVIAQLNMRSNEIGTITGAITGIAEQTNLLALNAAIEAARAGDQGRGFAVVASEVRKLAEESAVATKQIAALIANTQAETKDAVETMHIVERDVSNSVHHVKQTGEAFDEIQEAIEEVAHKVEEVSGAVQEMAAGATEILTSVSEIQGITEATATETENTSAATEEQMASMEEITASAQELSNMAIEMRKMTKKFIV